jgi:hypothetical protein
MCSEIPVDCDQNVLLLTRTAHRCSDQQIDPEKTEARLREFAAPYFGVPSNTQVFKLDKHEVIGENNFDKFRKVLAHRHCHVIVVDSLEHIATGIDLFTFLQFAVRHRIRVIALVDRFDSYDVDWHSFCAFNAMHHSLFATEISEHFDRAG